MIGQDKKSGASGNVIYKLTAHLQITADSTLSSCCWCEHTGTSAQWGREVTGWWNTLSLTTSGHWKQETSTGWGVNIQGCGKAGSLHFLCSVPSQVLKEQSRAASLPEAGGLSCPHSSQQLILTLSWVPRGFLFCLGPGLNHISHVPVQLQSQRAVSSLILGFSSKN